MDRYWLINPIAGYRRFQRWRERRQYDCAVTINKPNIVVRGKLKNHKTNPHRFISFLGIPYARPPVGELRFQPPQPLSRKYFRRYSYGWTAYWLPPFGIQYYPEFHSCFGSEDCLYLNVHIPNIPVPQQDLLPVFVYIHGGGLDNIYGGGIHKGDPSCMNWDHLVGEQKCVCVTIHYRQGALGFLNMRTENCRGNAGLKDQVMALQWIRDNIKPFGGNPENVTICGHSAGGSCVNLHMISPLSRGLFHKAIVMSGGIYCTWDYGGNWKHVKRPFKLAFGKENVSRYLVVQMLKRNTADELLPELDKLVTIGTRTLEQRKWTVLFKPSVECIPEDAFLPDRVERLMSAAEPVPTIAGITSQEGYRFYRSRRTTLADPGPGPVVRCPVSFHCILKENLNWTYGSILERLHALRDAYFPNLDGLADEAIREKFATLITDIHFRRFYDNFKIGNPLKSKSQPCYVYLFDYCAGVFLLGSIFNPHRLDPCGCEHGDDLFYLLYKKTVRLSLTAFITSGRKNHQEKVRKSETVVRRMNELWASFCRDGGVTLTALLQSRRGKYVLSGPLHDYLEWRVAKPARADYVMPRERILMGKKREVPKGLEGDVTWIPHTRDNFCHLRISEGLEMRLERLNEARWQEFNDICQGAVERPYVEGELGMLVEEDEN